MYGSAAKQEAASVDEASDNRSKSFVDAIQRSRTPILGVSLSIPSSMMAQLGGISGAQFAFIDMEHSPLSSEMMTMMVHSVVSASRGFCHPLVRIPSHGVEWIKWALDSGAAGIIIPMVNNSLEMEDIINKAVYPPVGRRSFGPFNAPFGNPDGPHSGIAGYMARSQNQEIAIIPMIESREGVDNIESILNTRGVSGVFVGPYDLRLAMGLPGAMDGKEEEFVQALSKVVGAAKRFGKVVGTIGMGQEVAEKRARDGFDFLVSIADSSVVSAGFAKGLEAASKGLKDPTKGIAAKGPQL